MGKVGGFYHANLWKMDAFGVLGENELYAMVSKRLLFQLCVCTVLFGLTGTSNAQTTLQFARMNSGPLFYYEHVMNNYADSLNFWSPGSPLPGFILDPDIDHSRLYYFREFNEPGAEWLYSFRKILFDRTINIDLLEALINHPDERLDKLYDPEEHPSYPHMGRARKKDRTPGPNILWMDFTTRELARKRLEELRRN